MTIMFEPSRSLNGTNDTHSSQPKLSIFQKALNLIEEAYLRENLETHTYCERIWSKNTGTSPSQASQVFMKSCANDLEAVKAFMRWSRFN